jgi:hypothetical protein
MIPLAAAIKAGAVCMALLSPDALFCHVKGHKDAMICMRDGCHTPQEVARSKRLLAKVYGEK